MQNGEGMLLVQVQHLVVRYNGRRSGHEALNITARFLNFPPNSSFYIHVASFLVQTNNHFYNLIRVFINIVEKRRGWNLGCSPTIYLRLGHFLIQY